jgi:hypothetical protein
MLPSVRAAGSARRSSRFGRQDERRRLQQPSGTPFGDGILPTGFGAILRAREMVFTEPFRRLRRPGCLREFRIALDNVLIIFLLGKCTSPEPSDANGMRSRRRSPTVKQGSMPREGTWRRSTGPRGCSISKSDAMKPSSRGTSTGSRSRKSVSKRLATPTKSSGTRRGPIDPSRRGCGS